jgi:hypothetical protein
VSARQDHTELHCFLNMSRMDPTIIWVDPIQGGAMTARVREEGRPATLDLDPSGLK